MNNPQIFPFDEIVKLHDRPNGHIYHEGMTLRDYFAGQA